MINKALASLRPNASWVIEGYTYDGIQWLDEVQTKPTLEEVNAEIARLQADYDAKQYQRDRANEYPSIVDQLDMLWHAIDNESLDKSSQFYTALKSVKDTYAKP